MKLLLASNGQFLIEEGYKLVGIPVDKIRIGYITTASKRASSNEYIKIHEKMMRNHNLYFEDIDIENKNENDLRKFFADKNIIHMEGGNTYHLLKAIKQSGFDKILKDLIDKGMVYVGTSAGSSIVGPTIEFSSHIPKEATSEELKSLNMVPFLIKSHYTDDKEAEYSERIKTLKYPIRFLRDGQGILIENGKYTFVGSGEEVKLK